MFDAGSGGIGVVRSSWGGRHNELHLQPTEKRIDMIIGCNRLEKVAHNLYRRCNLPLIFGIHVDAESSFVIFFLFRWLIHGSDFDP
jgi:hypothetical protein